MNRLIKTVLMLFVQVAYSVMLYLMGFCIASMIVLWCVIVCQRLGMDVYSVRLLRCCLAGAVPFWIGFEVNVWLRVFRQMKKERRMQQAERKAKLNLSTPAEDEAERTEREILEEEALFTDGEDATEAPQEAQ